MPAAAAAAAAVAAAADEADEEEGDSFVAATMREKWRPALQVFAGAGAEEVSAEALRRGFADFGAAMSAAEAAAMLVVAAGRPVPADGAVTLAQFAAVMEAPFKAEHWAMAQARPRADFQ
jgi:hypothetical protein